MFIIRRVKNQARLGHTVASSKIMVNLLFGMVCVSSQIYVVLYLHYVKVVWLIRLIKSLWFWYPTTMMVNYSSQIVVGCWTDEERRGPKFLLHLDDGGMGKSQALAWHQPVLLAHKFLNSLYSTLVSVVQELEVEQSLQIKDLWSIF